MHLSNYWDQQLFDLLYFGSPLDFNRSTPMKGEEVNDNSAVQHHRYIEAYLSGPFKEYPCPVVNSVVYILNSDNRRGIFDLSWPLGQSVNGGIDKNSNVGTDFSLHLPTIYHITEQLKILGKGCHLYKTDISSLGISRWTLWIMIS